MFPSHLGVYSALQLTSFVNSSIMSDNYDQSTPAHKPVDRPRDTLHVRARAKN